MYSCALSMRKKGVCSFGKDKEKKKTNNKKQIYILTKELEFHVR